MVYKVVINELSELRSVVTDFYKHIRQIILYRINSAYNFKPTRLSDFSCSTHKYTANIIYYN